LTAGLDHCKGSLLWQENPWPGKRANLALLRQQGERAAQKEQVLALCVLLHVLLSYGPSILLGAPCVV